MTVDGHTSKAPETATVSGQLRPGYRWQVQRENIKEGADGSNRDIAITITITWTINISISIFTTISNIIITITTTNTSLQTGRYVGKMNVSQRVQTVGVNMES